MMDDDLLCLMIHLSRRDSILNNLPSIKNFRYCLHDQHQERALMSSREQNPEAKKFKYFGKIIQYKPHLNRP